MEWSKAQKKTIELRDKNILVSAAAGSGKTAVLIERIKQLVINDRVDLDRFLITTFTNAASLEMKERLETAIRDELQSCGKDKEKRVFLKKQLELLPRASIGTFHNFALEIMKQYFYLTDLEPGFKIGDDVQVFILKNESADELFEDRFENDFEKFKEFLKKYSGDRNERRIKANIISIYDELRSIPHYLKWAENTTEMLNEKSPLEALGIESFIFEAVKDHLEEAGGFYLEAADLIYEQGIESLAEKAEQDARKVEALKSKAAEILNSNRERGSIDREEAETFAGSLKAFKANVMRASKEEQESYNLIKEKVSELRKNGKKLIDDAAARYFSRSFDDCDEELRAVYEDTKYFLELISGFEAVLKEKKRERNMVDFDDIMHYAIDILENPMAAEEYRHRFEYLFIDEFQDSNMLQEMIVEKIAGENNLFMVGDVKQSIYKFRLAEPEIFKRKYKLYGQASEHNSERIDLNNNFRSKFNVTRTVNSVFERLMEDYDENARLHCSIDDRYKGYESRLTVIDKGAGEENTAEGFNAEGAVCAEIIRENLGKGIYDVKRGCSRPMEYRDMVVLSRSKASIPEIERYLNNEGIPAFGEAQGGYFDTVEIQVFINLLKVIDNKRRDIPLISVMQSVLFDFGLRELAQIRIACGEGSFYNAVKKYGEEGENPEIKKKIAAMLDKLSYWKALSKTVSLEELLRRLMYDTGYYDYCSGLPVGKQRVSNLRMLADRGAAFEKTNYSGLYGFLSYIEAMEKSSVSVGEAKLIGEDENVVRVMTVHKSKGLEFPLVILSGAGRRIKAGGAGTSAVIHKDFALGMPFVNRKECWHRKTILQKAIEGKKAREDLEEEIRILYVAMTRAMDRLEIVGSVNDAQKLDERNVSKKSYLDMLYPVFMSGGSNVNIVSPEEKFYDAGTQSMRRSEAKMIFEGIHKGGDEEAFKLVDERLSYEYPYSAGKESVKSKYSVTELSSGRAFDEERFNIEKPEFFAGERKMTASDLGTAMHLVMEKLDFSRALDEGLEYVEQTVDNLRSKGALTKEEAEAVNLDNILGFFSSDIGRRAARAEKLEKEREFILLKDIEGEETIVQGIIDCYFEDEKGLTLIDYKNIYTGRNISEESVIEKYQPQLSLYKEAILRSTGKKVDEAYIYLFSLKKFIKGR